MLEACHGPMAYSPTAQSGSGGKMLCLGLRHMAKNSVFFLPKNLLSFFQWSATPFWPLKLHYVFLPIMLQAISSIYLAIFLL
jgi:hypothetical protein